jgi:hypothetical protein
MRLFQCGMQMRRSLLLLADTCSVPWLLIPNDEVCLDVVGRTAFTRAFLSRNDVGLLLIPPGFQKVRT